MVNLHGVISSEWINSMIHFIDKDSQGPPVDWFSMAFVEENLGGNIFGSTTQGIGSVEDHFSKAKICEFKVAIGVDEKIFRLQVSVNDVKAVHVFKNRGHLSGIEGSVKRLKLAYTSKVDKEFTSLNELHDNIEVALILVESFELDYEWLAHVGD